MSTNIVKFLQKVQADETLQARYDEICRDVVDEAEGRKLTMELAREAGVDLQESDFAIEDDSEDDIDESDLESAAGGMPFSHSVVRKPPFL